MVDVPEPPAGDANDPAGATSAPPERSRARSLDRRTLAICVCVALIAAIAAGLVASVALGDDPADGTGTGSGGIELAKPTDINSDRLLAIKLETVEGEKTTLGSFRAGQKPMLVNFWQSSCTPCVDEMPLLDTASATNRDVTFVGVATQDRLSKAKELARQTDITYPWVQDVEGNLYYEAKGAGMPTTLLLDAGGTVVATKTGAFKDEAELKAFLGKVR